MPNDEIDSMRAQGFALEIAAVADKLTSGGADALLVAGALIGCGIELLSRVESRERAARTLKGLAEKLRNPLPAPTKAN